MDPARAASFLLRRFRIPNHQSEAEMRVAPAFGRLLERVFRSEAETSCPCDGHQAEALALTHRQRGAERWAEGL